jgi:holo-[acyl-carrier protein] synthase
VVIGTGVDLAEIDRIEQALAARHGVRFRMRVFTEGEQKYCDSRGRGRGQSYAARFAAKEAVMKALGVGWGGDAAWHEIEVVRARGAAPHLVLSGSAAATACRLGIVRWSLSLTHAANLAAAFVVAEDAGA